MRKFITKNSQWESMLPALKFALNSAPHATKRYSPFQIIYGRCPNLAHMLHTPTQSYSEEESVQRLVYMKRITQDVCKWQDEAFIQQKREFDKRSNTRTVSAGDIVYVTRPHSGHLTQKFQPPYKGPFSVITQKSVTLRFVPFHFVSGHFVPVISSPGHFVPGHFVPWSSRPLVISFPLVTSSNSIPHV
jgi:hypothetical protein